MAASWAGSRMTLVSCQERDRMRGVSNWETLPWPPLVYRVRSQYCSSVCVEAYLASLAWNMIRE